MLRWFGEANSHSPMTNRLLLRELENGLKGLADDVGDFL